MSEATPIGSGRYGLLGTLSTTLPRIVRHRGVDTILDRDVTILVLTDATLHRDNVLESASRAVLVEDQRLQQVYDVERAEPSVIVTEPLTGRTFSSLVSRGMPPTQARAIIGETAQALDAGARKGLHHLNLSPESIRVLPDGTIKVSGLGIEAAALDLESRVAGHDPSAADRADARALVEILYYGLTGRWPGKRPGIPSAPRLGGAPVKPSTLVPGIDPILDELCERTWSSQPPTSSAEVARSLGTWDTVVGQGGLKLSGGERQRVSIARAFLKDAPILLLDEITSALDGENESAITEVVRELSEGRTVIMVAHRLSTVRQADEVVFLEPTGAGARVAQCGTPQELAAVPGPFRDFIEASTASSRWHIRQG